MQYVTLYLRYSTLKQLQEKMICHCFSISLQTLSHFGVCYTKYLAELGSLTNLKIAEICGHLIIIPKWRHNGHCNLLRIVVRLPNYIMGK